MRKRVQENPSHRYFEKFAMQSNALCFIIALLSSALWFSKSLLMKDQMLLNRPCATIIWCFEHYYDRFINDLFLSLVVNLT